jgi:hypothetical protein
MLKKIVEWAKQSAIRYKGTNWEAMRESWRDIQDLINEGLSCPWYI